MLDWQDSALPKLCANVWIVTERLNLFFAQQTVQRISIRFTTERHEPETSAFLQDCTVRIFATTLREM